jgi:hypothetical protein
MPLVFHSCCPPQAVICEFRIALSARSQPHSFTVPINVMEWLKTPHHKTTWSDWHPPPHSKNNSTSHRYTTQMKSPKTLNRSNLHSLKLYFGLFCYAKGKGCSFIQSRSLLRCFANLVMFVVFPPWVDCWLCNYYATFTSCIWVFAAESS